MVLLKISRGIRTGPVFSGQRFSFDPLVDLVLKTQDMHSCIESRSI